MKLNKNINNKFTLMLKVLFFCPVEVLMRLVPYPPIRVIMLKLLGAKVSIHSFIYDIRFTGMIFGSFKNLTIEEDTFIGQDVIIDLFGKVHIEKGVVIASRASILTHQTTSVIVQENKNLKDKIGNVRIKEGAYIGNSAVIANGVTVGKNSVVGALSFVIEDVSDNSTVAGIPAKPLKK